MPARFARVLRDDHALGLVRNELPAEKLEDSQGAEEEDKVNLYVCIYVYVCVYIYIYIHVYIVYDMISLYTYMFIYTYITISMI